MNWSPSVIVGAIAIGLVSFSVLLDRWLKYYWKDGRTRKHRTGVQWLIALSILSVIAALVMALIEKSRAERQSQRLAKALKDADDQRKAQAMAGRLEAKAGFPQHYQIGQSKTVFVVFGGSMLAPFAEHEALRKVAEQNFVTSENRNGMLAVSARIQARDGMVAEIRDNEWLVAPAPRAWDRNYSTNALEVKDSDGRIVFQVKLCDGSTNFDFWDKPIVRIQGIFFDSDGNGLAFTGSDSNAGCTVSIIRSNSHLRLPEIKPLFRYPSSLHLGEMAEQNQ